MNSERRQVWGLRVLALAIAVALWFVLSFEQRETRSEKLIEASVSYIRPDGVEILDPVQRVDVMLSGPTDQVNRVTSGDVGVQVDLRNAEPGPTQVNLGPDNVVTLPQGLRVDRIRPTTLDLSLDRLITRRLPVEPQVTGEPAAGALVGDLTVAPPEVAVTGPESQLSTIDSVQTAPVSLDGHAITFQESVPVVLPDILAVRDIQPPRVTVSIPLQVSTPQGGQARSGAAQRRGGGGSNREPAP